MKEAGHYQNNYTFQYSIQQNYDNQNYFDRLPNVQEEIIVQYFQQPEKLQQQSTSQQLITKCHKIFFIIFYNYQLKQSLFKSYQMILNKPSKSLTPHDNKHKLTLNNYLTDTIFTIISIGSRLACKPIELLSYFRRMKKINEKYTLTQMAIKDIIIVGLKNDIKNYVILLPLKDYIKNYWFNFIKYQKQRNVVMLFSINFIVPALINAIRGLLFYNSDLHKIQQVNLSMQQTKITKILKQRKYNNLSILKNTIKYRNIGLFSSILGLSISAGINIGIFDTIQQLYLYPTQQWILMNIIIGTLTGYIGRYINNIFQWSSSLKFRSKVIVQNYNQTICFKSTNYSQIWRKQYKKLLQRSNIPFIYSLRNGIILTVYQYLKQNYSHHLLTQQ